MFSKYDRNRIEKGEFEYKNYEGPKIAIHNVPSDEKEARIVKKIAEKVPPSQKILILLPFKGFSKLIIDELKKARIKYTAPLPLPGEGLPLLSTLSQWLENDSDSLALRECIEALINNPISGIPSNKVRKRENSRKRAGITRNK